MSDVITSDFPVAKDAYVAFDGLTIKEKLRQRFNESGVFTDQNFEGSNLAAFNDGLAMVFSLLLYNVNQTVNEGAFSTAMLYENMNRIVKDFDYKPVGHQTATLGFGMSASDLNAGTYTIPRYASIRAGGISYSFKQDISFSKTTDTTLEDIQYVGENNLLYQGNYVEFPTYTAAGSDNEILFLTTSDSILVDNFGIDVYVKSGLNKWEKWAKTQSLYLHTALEKVYEVRFNENKRYEIKFGNGVNGVKLSSGDLVGVYYLKSDGSSGEVGSGVLGGKSTTSFNSARYTAITNDTITYTSFMTNSQMSNLSFNNSCASTTYGVPETVAQMRTNAPASFRNQYNLVTTNSYETFVRSNFSTFIHDVKAKNNSEYLDSYIKYFYDLGLTKPQLESRALFNQTKFADSCNFNNIYLFVVPKSISSNLSYLVPAQKSLIIETMKESKIATSETVLLDPVYLAIDLMLSDSNTVLLSDLPSTEIYIEKNYNSRRNDVSIKKDVDSVINDFFARDNVKLGQTLNLNSLVDAVLGIEGVKKVFTRNTVSGDRVEGLRFGIWNPVFGDISLSTIVGSVALEDFQFPYLYNTNFIDRITIESSLTKFEGVTI